MKLYILLFSTAVLLMSGCGEKEVIEPEVLLTEIATGTSTDNEYTIKILADTLLFVGYNNIYAEITNASGEPVTEGAVEIIPTMHMTDMTHGCPVEYPDDRTPVDGRYLFHVVFVMPGMDANNYWDLGFKITNTNGSVHETTIKVDVVQPERVRLRSFVSEADQTTRYFVTLIEPKGPTVGSNDLEVGVYKKMSMMSWPAVESVSFDMETWMPSMDHGSPNNVAPVHTGKGHYKGKVNFTMTGDWEIRLSMKENNVVCGNPVFEFLF
ncbi:MAG: FixH family protein [Cyclobacteriaceae bacterium]|nr:FixH family protein [Cyclobacteriaceae bacterium]